MQSRWREASGYLLIVCASCFWGSSATLGKILMRRGLSTFALMQIRSAISSIVILALLGIAAPRHLRIKAAELPALLLFAIPGLALVNVSYYYAVRVLPV